MISKPPVALHPLSKDLEASRDVDRRQRDGFARVLGWLETFRSRHCQVACRETCVRFGNVKGASVEWR